MGDDKSKDINSQNTGDILQEIYDRSNLTWLLWFLAIFLVIYFCVSIFSSSSETSSLRTSRILDFIVLTIIFIYILTLSLKSSSSVSQYSNDFYNKFVNYMSDPYSIFGLVLFIIALYLTIYIVKVPMTPGVKPFTVSFIENIAWLLFLILLIVNFFRIVLDVDLMKMLPSKTTTTNHPLDNKVTNIFNYYNTTYQKDASGNKQDASGNKQDASGNKPNQVFNISNNLYTYDEAQDICAAFDSTLATYEQIENAYNDGAEWCAYGWSDKQMAFFPTQKSTWNKLQKNEKTKNACGRPGINGGYMANPSIRFGVNCYGKKPDPTEYEKKLMQENAVTNIQDSKLNDKVKFWKDNRDKLLVLNSFNRNKWSEY